MQALASHAHAIAGGAEPELTLVVDAMFPMDALFAALRVVGDLFPASPPRIYVETMGAAAALAVDGTCAIDLLLEFSSDFEILDGAS